MKDRLIELIGQIDTKCGEMVSCEDCPAYGKGASCINHYIADHFIANGVIVPPCKVGDTVWLIYTHTNWHLEIIGHSVLRGKINAIEINESDGICFKTECSTFFPEHIGETVFLTKEEAERALKEREQRGC